MAKNDKSNGHAPGEWDEQLTPVDPQTSRFEKVIEFDGGSLRKLTLMGSGTCHIDDGQGGRLSFNRGDKAHVRALRDLLTKWLLIEDGEEE